MFILETFTRSRLDFFLRTPCFLFSYGLILVSGIGGTGRWSHPRNSNNKETLYQFSSLWDEGSHRAISISLKIAASVLEGRGWWFSHRSVIWWGFFSASLTLWGWNNGNMAGVSSLRCWLAPILVLSQTISVTAPRPRPPCSFRERQRNTRS